MCAGRCAGAVRRVLGTPGKRRRNRLVGRQPCSVGKAMAETVQARSRRVAVRIAENEWAENSGARPRHGTAVAAAAATGVCHDLPVGCDLPAMLLAMRRANAVQRMPCLRVYVAECRCDGGTVVSSLLANAREGIVQCHPVP
jgi:hypothetical protein